MMHQKPQILLVVFEMPEPIGRGTPIRNFNLIKHLHADYDFSILCVGTKRRYFASEELESWCSGIHTVEACRQKPQSKWRQRLMRWIYLFGSKPLHVRYYYPDALLSTGRELLRSTEFDILDVEHPEMGDILFEPTNCGKILGHDIITPKLESYLSITSSRKEYFYRFIDLQKFKRFERRAIATCDLFITCSKQDYELIKSISPQKPVSIVPNGVDLEYYQPLSESGGEDGSILFVGSLNVLPNIDGIVHFHNKIFPLILKKAPHAHLTIVGKDPDPSVKKLSDSHTTVIGWVDDVRPYYDRSQVVVAPIRSGGGTSLKVPEAFAMRRPVVSTSFGVRGFDIMNGKHLITADTPDEMAQAIIGLLSDRSLGERIGKTAESWCRENLGWDAISKELDCAYRKVFKMK